jgi:Tfp pilus assembly protein PilE
MAGSKLKSKVQASTILEVVISMVIIVVVFGIAMMIYTNVLRMSLSVKKLKAQAILNEMALKAEHSTADTTPDVMVDDFRIEQETKPYNGNAALIEIHLTAYDNNKQKIAEFQQVITNSNE